MLILPILRSLLFGLFFTLLSVSIAYYFALSMKQVYHTKGISKKNSKYLVLILVNLISSTTWIALAWGSQLFWVDLLTLFTLNLIANVDGLTGKIPIYFLLMGVVLGLILGSLKDQFIVHVIGGVSNLILSMMIFFAGQTYKKHVLKQIDTNPVFGIGDVYACGTFGFLFGSPVGNLAILLVLILTILGAGIQSLVTRAEFLKLRVKLGISFYLATVLILMAKTR